MRRWTSGHRWVTFAMLAHDVLVVTAAHEQAGHPFPDGLIPSTCNGIRHLFSTLPVQPVQPGDQDLRLEY
ncbi:hypothetical protein ACFCZ1_06895 [Streptomyces sp. NPDC056224]|uniref:hypothetical protein n=1 Tax=Streptomyces sp. NPDC056224 TaxID=3345750 RepID=UPI0035E134CE